MRWFCAFALVIVVSESSIGAAETARDPFAFFRPSVITSDADRQHLDAGGTVSRVIAGQQRAIAVFSATPVDVNGDRFVSWMRRIAALKEGEYVAAIERFSNPPRLEDLERLTLDAGDIEDLERCRPGRCGLKLSAAEIEELQRTLHAAGGNRRNVIQDAFRRLVLRRVQTYAAGGHHALASYEDRSRSVSLEASFSGLVQQSAFLGQHIPALAAFLDRWPDRPMPEVESFLYWSKERLGAKAIISVTQISIMRGDGHATPDAIAVGKQVFATHYMDASLSVTAIVCDHSTAQRYMAYLNRTDVDVLGGLWGGMVRRVLERRLRSEAPAILQTLRGRLESGDPPR
jgi:hypothetical protein